MQNIEIIGYEVIPHFKTQKSGQIINRCKYVDSCNSIVCPFDIEANEKLFDSFKQQVERLEERIESLEKYLKVEYSYLENKGLIPKELRSGK